MDILPRGVIAPNPSELLMNRRFSELLSYASEKYDHVIIDTPPILAVTDPAIIASHTGVTLLVARYGVTHKKEIEMTQKRFKQNGVDVKGVVLNAVLKSGRKSYYDYAHYNYDSNE